MRIAVLIIALFLTLIVGLQSCAITAGGGMLRDSQTYGSGVSGIFVALLFLLGAAFVMGLPRVAMAMFALAAVVGLVAGFGTEFADLRIWGFVAVALAAMSFFGYRELRRKRVTIPAGEGAQQ